MPALPVVKTTCPASAADASLASAATRRDENALRRSAPRASSSALRQALLGLCHTGQDKLAVLLLEQPAPGWSERSGAIVEALSHCLSRNKRSVFTALLPLAPAFDSALHAPLIHAAAAAFGHAPFWAEALGERYGDAARSACLLAACRGACAPAFGLRMARQWGPTPENPMPELREACVAAAESGAFKLADYLASLAPEPEALKALAIASPFRLPRAAARSRSPEATRPTFPIDPVAASAALALARAERLAASSQATPPTEESRAAPRRFRPLGIFERLLSATPDELDDKRSRHADRPPRKPGPG